MTDRAVPDEPSNTLPDEPSPDAYEWTAEPDEPDVAGMPGEFVNESDEGVPGVRREANPGRVPSPGEET